jgi:NitT/TauT family transport system ATP-binding protein
VDDVTIRISHVSKSFGKLKVLDDLNFEIKKGEKVLIFGPNGIGKTTILKMIAGILKADEGSVEVKGAVGYVFQEPRLLPWKTAVENINLVLSDRKKAMEWLKKVGLKDFENHYPNSLSGGMKQKVALARALAIEPQILLLDEPLTGLDFKSRDEILSLIDKILSANRSTVVYVTHNMKEVSNFTNKVLILPYSNTIPYHTLNNSQ